MLLLFLQSIVELFKEWQEYQLEAEVSDQANIISYGLAYTGEGTACIDNVSIKRVP